MPETQSMEMTADDIRRLLQVKFPPKTDGSGKPIVDREYVLTSIVISMAEHGEEQEKRIDKLTSAVQEMGAVVAIVAHAAGIDIAQVIAAVRSGARVNVGATETTEEEDDIGADAGGSGSVGAAGAGGGGAGGAAAGGPARPADKTPFPADASPNVKPGDPAQKVTAQAPKAADKPVTSTDQNENDEEDENGIPKPNVTSAGAKNAAPIPSAPPSSKAPNPNGAKASS